MNIDCKPFSIQRYFSFRERYGMTEISGKSNSKRKIGHYSMIQDTRISKASRGQDGGPYTMEKCNDNGSVLIITIDDEAIPMLVNGQRLKFYKKPLSKREFIEDLNKIVMVVEHVLASTSFTH